MDIIENRSGSLTDALNKIRIAETRILELKTDLSNWKIDADVDVYMGESTTIRVRIFKDNGDGFSFDMNGDAALAYVDDPDTLMQMISEKIYDVLYKKQIKETISSKLKLALENVKLRNKGSRL